ncbi:Uncharacterized membrane protein, DUF485 family [Thermodesulfobium acidiphilum]|uniref:Uncharacterized membrane protein, DUF485 family n=1 Tax=Thermodesulfobium acidiphilum TaxID=1794699 RepID=A0A2R4W287_THEAF|nr:DUF485 domain-containing protein [Thermodesulfobium acidiphilum]AWB10941.1 Uncharacterized membrane protein, DUF485 family [Thermodesulfobium acidiphilum]PMP85368.1 MAG: hypothetical protein C0174_04660 [Thermodesulfobium narugense]
MNNDLKKLNSLHKRVSFLFSVIVFLIYFGFIYLVAFDIGFLSNHFLFNLNNGLLCSFIVIASCLFITGIYVWWNNSFYEKELKKIKKIE